MTIPSWARAFKEREQEGLATDSEMLSIIEQYLITPNQRKEMKKYGVYSPLQLINGENPIDMPVSHIFKDWNSKLGYKCFMENSDEVMEKMAKEITETFDELGAKVKFE